MRHRTLRALIVPAAAALALTACGAGGDADDANVTIAVTTTVLGDVVTDLVGDLAEVVTIMPAGANAHDFQASAREAAVLAGADAIVVNGGGFEEGLLSVVDGAESDGVPVLDARSLLEGGEAHFFTDPLAVAEVADGLADELAEQVPTLDAAALRAQGDALIADLEELHAELEETLADVAEDRRVLITDHDVLGSFADRYDFEILATVIPTGSTSDGVSGGALAELVSVLRSTGVPAVFVEETAGSDLSDTLAAEVGDVEVVPLYAESLGAGGSEADTYAAMMRVNAQRIADALGG